MLNLGPNPNRQKLSRSRKKNKGGLQTLDCRDWEIKPPQDMSRKHWMSCENTENRTGLNKLNISFTPVFEHSLDAYELLKFQI